MSVTPSIKSALGSIVAPLLAGGLAGWLARSGTGFGGGGGPEGRIAPSRPLVLVTALAALGLAALIAWQAAGDAGKLGLAAAVAVLGGIAISALLPGYEVEWTHDGLEGPSAQLPPPFGPKRDFLQWRDLREVGQDGWGNWYVADGQGHRIRWNWSYAGHGHLMARVETMCPELFDDED